MSKNFTTLAAFQAICADVFREAQGGVGCFPAGSSEPLEFLPVPVSALFRAFGKSLKLHYTGCETAASGVPFCDSSLQNRGRAVPHRKQSCVLCLSLLRAEWQARRLRQARGKRNEKMSLLCSESF